MCKSVVEIDVHPQPFGCRGLQGGLLLPAPNARLPVPVIFTEGLMPSLLGGVRYHCVRPESGCHFVGVCQGFFLIRNHHFVTNPVTAYIDYCSPPGRHSNEQDEIRERAVLFFAVFGCLAGIYSMIKWFKAGVPTIGYGGLLLVIGLPMVCTLIRLNVLKPLVTANISLACMAIFCSLLIYHTGGIFSDHILWVVGIIVFVYLLADSRSGLLWFLITCGFILYLIYAERTGIALPVYSLSEAQVTLNRYSGYLLPMALIALAQAFSMRVRNQALERARDAVREANAQSQAAKTLSQQLAGILDQASSDSGVLLDSSKSLAELVTMVQRRSESIVKGVQQQAGETGSINDTLEEMATSVESSSDAIKEIQQLTDRTERDVSNSATIMGRAIHNMERIRESNAGIMSMMKVISDIADQTNLLALNAAIEAARAGDQGRGFAVVADEVRSLSIKSNQSAQQIRGLLQKAAQDVKEGVNGVNDAGKVLDDVVVAVQEVAGQVNQIAERILRQRGQIDAIVKASAQVNDISSQNARSGARLLEGSESLQQVAENLAAVAQSMHSRINTLSRHRQ